MNLSDSINILSLSVFLYYSFYGNVSTLHDRKQTSVIAERKWHEMIQGRERMRTDANGKRF
jgi:hypothetical protein